MILPSSKGSPFTAILYVSIPLLFCWVLLLVYKRYFAGPSQASHHLQSSVPSLTLDESKIQELDQVAFQIRSVALDHHTLPDARRSLLAQALVIWRFEYFLLNLAEADHPRSSTWKQEKKRVEETLQTVQKEAQ